VENIVRFIKSVRLGWYGHIERMQNRRMLKKIVTAKVEVTQKRDRRETSLSRIKILREREKERERMATNRREGVGDHT